MAPASELLRLSLRDLRFVHAPGVVVVVLRYGSGACRPLRVVEADEISHLHELAGSGLTAVGPGGAVEAWIRLETCARRRGRLVRRLAAAFAARGAASAPARA